MPPTRSAKVFLLLINLNAFVWSAIESDFTICSGFEKVLWCCPAMIELWLDVWLHESMRISCYVWHLGYVFLGESENAFVISDHSDHAPSKEPTNPLWTRIRRFLWCDMIRMIWDHKSVFTFSQKKRTLSVRFFRFSSTIVELHWAMEGKWGSYQHHWKTEANCTHLFRGGF